uniref:hypothetical protein n=1 Tax=Rhodococcus qingshengii TaxID=334542 RepID=UPI001C4DFAA9|nr:hypothetical protein [Rhodococcus qingshengii]
MRKLCAVAGFTALLVAAGTGVAAADPFLPGPESDIYTITTTETAATITLTAPAHHACNAGLILPGTPTQINAQIESAQPFEPSWTGLNELLAYDPNLVPGLPPEYLSPKTHTIALPTGTYTITGFCRLWDENGNPTDDEVTHFASFTIAGTEEPGEPIDPPTDGGGFGSLGALFGS